MSQVTPPDESIEMVQYMPNYNLIVSDPFPTENPVVSAPFTTGFSVRNGSETIRLYIS